MQWVIRDVPLGRNIQNIRLKKGLTQDQLVANMQIQGSSISRSTLANIETGRRNIKACDLKIMKEILDVPYENFFEN